MREKIDAALRRSPICHWLTLVDRHARSMRVFIARDGPMPGSIEWAGREDPGPEK